MFDNFSIVNPVRSNRKLRVLPAQDWGAERISGRGLFHSHARALDRGASAMPPLFIRPACIDYSEVAASLATS